MAISVKSKFAGFLRGLMGRGDAQPADRPVTSAAPLPAPPAPASASRVAAARTAPVPAARHESSEEIELPLGPVVAGLPLDMRAKLISAPPADQTIRLAGELVVGQLQFGAVKISFGELRHLAPGIFTNATSDLDNKLVSLPLQEILPRLNPAMLARRSVKKVQVSEEIVGPFAERGRGFSFTTQPLKGAAVKPVSEPVPAPAPAPEVPSSFVPPAAVRQVSSVAPVPEVPQRSITPIPPPSPLPKPNGANGTIGANGANGNGGNGHSHPIPISPLSPRSITPAGSGENGDTNGLHSNGNGHGGTNGNGHVPPLTPGLRLGPLNGSGRPDVPTHIKISAVPTPAASSAPIARPASGQPTLFAPLAALCEMWPAELKNEVLNSALAQASVPLDGAIILPGLKRGRVTMVWKQIRLLAQPGSTPSPNDNLEVELPLKVIAPLFLAAQKNPPSAPSKVSVSAEIPDLFFGFPQPSHPAAAPVAPVIPPLPLPRPVEQKAPEPKLQDTNFFVWGEKNEAPASDTVQRSKEVTQTDFMSRQAHPKDVVARAVQLEGVAGSVVAMQDGLRVASQVPAELNADTLAAFLPQIFERVSQSTRELRMGSLNNLNFTVGNVPWKIFRVNSVYFAAFGRAGQHLPSPQLAQLAAELDRKK